MSFDIIVKKKNKLGPHLILFVFFFFFSEFSLFNETI